MQKLFKRLSVAVLIASVVVFSLLTYATVVIPDEFHVTSKNEINSNQIFSFTINDGNIAERANAITNNAETNYELNIKLFNAIPVKKSKVKLSERKYVSLGGKIFGIRLFTEGVVVVSMESIMTSEGEVKPAEKSGIKIGDIIKEIDGKTVNSIGEVSNKFNQSDGKALKILLVRNDKVTEVKLTPVKSTQDGKYKAGLWVRDSTAGIGTMTFYDRETGIFGGLGHAVCDLDTGQELPLQQGDAVLAEIKGCYKGNDGAPGELCGVFGSKNIGSLNINGSTGVYGVLSEFDVHGDEIPVALENEVREGKAQIFCTVEGDTPRYYDAEIVKKYSSNQDTEKNMIVKITDPDLIAITGGIVQGMSGTPLIQNGKLIGAITHVFVNDPTQGYGIFAENMIVTANELERAMNLKRAS